MEVRLAGKAGFCFGVKRAVDKVYEQAEKAEGFIYTYGPIIHNEEVVKDLTARGVKVIGSKEELDGVESGTVIIRSHGVSREIQERIEARGLNLVDATCPFVKKIHKIVERESRKGAGIVIIGDAMHPEVEGIRGWCQGDVTVLQTEEEARNFTADSTKKLCLVSQTTFNYNKFHNLVEIISEKGYDIIVLNTICNATEERQTEARRIARESDGMIVIGGRHSSNTRKLFEICKNECENTYYIQTLDDLDVRQLHSMSCVGITAGASTPNNLIEEVLKECQK